MEKIIFIANNNISTGLSGGDRIFCEFIKNWKNKLQITLLGSQEAIEIAKREVVKDIYFIQTDKANQTKTQQAIATQITHTLRRLFKGLTALIKHSKQIKQTNYIYSVSDFYPDFIPAFLIKLFRPSIKWICGYYLIIPAPWSKQSPYKNESKLKGIFYWLMQRPTFLLAKLFADKILVTSQTEKDKFTAKKVNPERIIVVQGGVKTKYADKYLGSNRTIPVENRIYDACFVGRFHEQKGVLGLIDIWNIVVNKNPKARLAMIGNGALFEKVKQKINKYNLNNNIDLLGFMIKKPKHEIFKQSKLILHPAIFESGGMAAAEGMAWKLPAVSYDLPVLKKYYPQGMLKAKVNNKNDFAKKILLLLENEDKYKETAEQAYHLIQNKWKWEKRALQIYKQIFND